ncbi:hypothetical protein AB7813_05705 [Tardiphaga sp. 20_F10_N6_6]|uniref:hypothetical protein n=1 Tax=unclassified Tardiphaga TaxID=2631404 RepID=UPI003F276809
MTIFARIFRHGLLRISRRALVMVVLATYMFAGAMHGLCEFDVTNPSGATIVSLAEKAIGHSDKGVVADNHCHGCFSVTAQPLVFAAMPVSIETRTAVFHDVERGSLPRGIDPPPPKFLT